MEEEINIHKYGFNQYLSYVEMMHVSSRLRFPGGRCGFAWLPADLERSLEEIGVAQQVSGVYNFYALATLMNYEYCLHEELVDTVSGHSPEKKLRYCHRMALDLINDQNTRFNIREALGPLLPKN